MSLETGKLAKFTDGCAVVKVSKAPVGNLGVFETIIIIFHSEKCCGKNVMQRPLVCRHARLWDQLLQPL